jgi:hypothetical protein
MRRQRRLLWVGSVVTTGALTGGLVLWEAPSYASPTTDRAEQLRYATETMNLASSSYLSRKSDFLAAGCATASGCRKPSPYNQFNWSSDSCSWTPSSLKELFDPACQEHDFGYRNFGKGLTLGRNETTRRWIDDRFRTEMKSICNSKYQAWWQYANLRACRSEADTLYAVVRKGRSWSR